MQRIKKYKSLLSFLLALLITVGTISSDLFSPVEVDAATSAATKRVVNFINLAAGKSNQDLESGLNLTKDELRFLGVYISNFFIPFGTELGTTKEDVNTQVTNDIKDALGKSLKFGDELSTVLTEQIMGLSRSNCQELQFRVSNDNPANDYTSVSNFKLNYYNFLRLMLGETKAVFEGYDSEGENAGIIGGILEGKYNYGYFGYERNGEFIPMFDCSLTMNCITPSMYAFYQCLASVNLEKGYGLSFFDFTRDEAENDSTLKSMLKDMNEDDIYKMSAYGTTINVDCFGNIILKGGNHQYIAVPGCMNPYTWVSVKPDGSDAYRGGECYNIATFQGLGLADTDNLIEASDTKISYAENNKDLKVLSISDGKFVDNINKVLEDFADDFNEDFSRFLKGLSFGKLKAQYRTDGYSMRMLRGSTDKEVGSKSGLSFMNTKYLELAIKAEKGFRAANPNDYSYYASIYGGLEQGFMSTTGTVNNRIACWGKYSKKDITNSRCKVIDKLAFIDNLGAFGFDNTEKEIDYQAINFLPYLDDKGKSPNQLFSEWGKDAANGFTNMYSDIQAGKMNTQITASDAAIVGVYTTYAISALYQDNDDSKKATIGKLGFRMNRDNMVSISKDPISIPSSVAEDIITKTIRNWIYYILHPTMGLDYVRILIKNKTDALLVGWHNDMVGTNGVGATTGTTLYKSNYGYVTTPDLSEINWTSSLIDYYNSAIPFLIVVMIVIMLFSYITSVMSLQKCCFGVLIFSAFLLTPVAFINGVVSISNRVSQNIYGEKFTYWALVQQESYAIVLDNASSGDSYSNYLKTLYATNNTVYSNQGSDSIVLRWQAPKKLASLMLSKNDTNILSNLSSSKLIGYVLNNNAFSGESYLSNKESSYMFRSYTDIGNFSRYIYNGLDQGIRSSRSSLISDCYDNVSKDFKSSISSMGKSYESDRTAGYTNYNGDGSKSSSNALRIIKPLSSKMYNDALSKAGTIKDLTIDEYVGINQDAFNFSVAMFNKAGENYKDNLLANCKKDNKSDLERYLNNYTDEDLSGLAAYSLMSESPFYYFSWSLYDMGMNTTSKAINGYKSLLLGKDNAGFFYNTEGNGELKDFMDMKSLFTYVIPYLRAGNLIVEEWDSIYGTKIYDGVPTEEGHQNDSDIKASEELQQKYWHNLNVARLYEIYTPWVDLMYDCSYAKPTTIKAFGNKYEIKDPLNPASYPEERPMIFSVSEMTDYGLTESDLTEVERLILKTNEGIESRMYELLNYYNFSDLSLNTAAAINCAFEFNINFSENGIFSNNINLYPQSFEIADFSYDAFLRFILANSIGIDMTSQDDFYATVVKNSSTFTAIVLIFLDILSQYLLPAFKIFFLIAIFLSAIILIIVTAFRVDPEQRFISKLAKGIFTPMIGFLVITLGFAYVVSLFMGKGNNAVTETPSASISMGDPVVVMLAVAALDIICGVLYYKLVKGVIADIKHNFKMAVNYVQGVVGGFATMLKGAVGKIGGKLSSNGTGNSGGSGSGGNVSEEGTGRVSPRAAKRASEKTSEGRSEDEGSTNSRVNDTKRKTVDAYKEDISEEKSKEKEDKLNKKSKSGLSKIKQDEDSPDLSEEPKIKEHQDIDKNKVKETSTNK